MDDPRSTELESLRREVAELRQKVAVRERVNSFDLLEHAAEGWVALNAEWQVIYLNSVAAALTGQPKEALLGRNFWELVPELSNDEVQEGASRSLRERVIVRCQIRCATLGAWFEITVHPAETGVVLICCDITKRKSAEEALKKSEERFRTMADAMPGVLWSADSAGAMIYFNQQWISYVGDTSGASFGWGWTQYLDPTDVERCLERWRRSIASGQPLEMICRFRRASDGEYRVHLVRAIAMKDASGQIHRWFGASTTIHEHMETERELREANEKLRALIQYSPLPLVAFNPTGAVTLWNPAAESLFGWKEEEVLGKPIPFIPQEKQEEHRAMRRRDLEGQTFSNQLIRRQRKDGSPIDLSVSTAALRDPNGALTGIMSLYADVTEQRRTQEALYLSNVRFEVALKGSPVSVFNQDLSLRYTWSHSQHVTFGSEVLLGRTDIELNPCSEIEHLTEVKRRILQTGVGVREEFCIPLAGAPAYYQMTIEPLRDAAGAVIGLTGATVDVTAQKRIEEELRDANRALTRANEDLNQFANSASHDLQEPLRVIAVYCQMLESKHASRLDEEGAEFLAFVIDAAKRMQLLIRDLLAYTKLASLAPVGELPLVDSNAALRTAIFNLKALIDESGAQIIRGDLPPVRIHPAHLQQLLQNLVGNGLKYHASAPPVVRITGVQKGSACILRVEDNGIGIDPLYHRKIFGLFKRLHTTEYAGTGIGLAICQRIVERYNGKIWVESMPSEGSSFYVAIPNA